MIKKVSFISIFVILTFLIAELLLRIIGFKTYEYIELDPFYCKPDYWTIDDYLGFCHLPGQYTCYIAKSNRDVPFVQDYITFSVHHLQDSSRATYDVQNDTTQFNNELHLYGNSITWGHGIDDTSTMAWIMQETLDDWQVKNYGIPAGSIVQSYLWLKRNVQKGNKPDIAIINYSSFLHDKRNAWSWQWRKVWQSTFRNVSDSLKKRSQWEKAGFSYARVEEGRLKIRYLPLSHIVHNLPLVQTSVIMKMVNEVYQNLRDKHFSQNNISKHLLMDLHNYCKRKGINLVINGITNDKKTIHTLTYFKRNNITTNPFSANFCCNKKIFNLEPYDPHPSEFANQIFAYKLLYSLHARGML